jgi:hypothetical protein
MDNFEVNISSPLPLPPGITLNNTPGALQIGVLFSIFLFSILSMQIYYFFENYPHDRPLVKVLVCRIIA